MMSSEATSSPVSASTLAYLMRWPVLRLIWLKLTFSVSEVAGYSATGQVTSERRKKPFQLARGGMRCSEKRKRRPARITPGNRVSSERGRNSLNGVNCVRFGTERGWNEGVAGWQGGLPWILPCIARWTSRGLNPEHDRASCVFPDMRRRKHSAASGNRE